MKEKQARLKRKKKVIRDIAKHLSKRMNFIESNPILTDEVLEMDKMVTDLFWKTGSFDKSWLIFEERLNNKFPSLLSLDNFFVA